MTSATPVTIEEHVNHLSLWKVTLLSQGLNQLCPFTHSLFSFIKWFGDIFKVECEGRRTLCSSVQWESRVFTSSGKLNLSASSRFSYWKSLPWRSTRVHLQSSSNTFRALKHDGTRQVCSCVMTLRKYKNFPLLPWVFNSIKHPRPQVLEEIIIDTHVPPL